MLGKHDTFWNRNNDNLFCKMQGREFAHSLIAHSLICSFRSNQMSNCKRFAQIAQSGHLEEMSDHEQIA